MRAKCRKCTLRSGSGASAAKPLHSAAKRKHMSACLWTLNANIGLLLKGGSACISQSSAGQQRVPVMELRWGRVAHLASVMFTIFEHVHDIVDLSGWCRRASSGRNVVDGVVRNELTALAKTSHAKTSFGDGDRPSCPRPLPPPAAGGRASRPPRHQGRAPVLRAGVGLFDPLL